MGQRFLAALLVIATLAIAPLRAEVSGATGSGQVAPAPVWTALAQMNRAERANSCIEVELADDASPVARDRAVAAAALWNDGRYEAALAEFESLGGLVDPGRLAIGNCWRTPVPTPPAALWDSDVRIGNRHSISLVSFDIHRRFGNLFAALLYQDVPGEYHNWSVNLSANGGANWVETFAWYASYPLRSLSTAVLTNYCYVAYGASTHRAARLRRFNVVTGEPVKFGTDNDDMYITVYTAAANDSIKELALTSNQDFDPLYNWPRLYCVGLLYGGSVKYAWSDSMAVDWDTSLATGVTDAANGLDACTNEDAESTFIWISFYDRSGNLRVTGRRGIGFRNFLSRPAGGGDRTAIGAYHDTVLCAFDYATRGVVRCEANYGGGRPDSLWHPGYPGGDSTTASGSPDVALRKGGGEGLVYRYQAATRELRYVWRHYWGAWSAPVAIADHEPADSRPAVEHLASNAYGVVYLRQSDRSAYFDRADWPGVAEQRRLVTEEGVLGVIPNPLTSRGRVHYALDRAASLRVQLCDRTGRVVRTIFDGRSPAGRHSLAFDATGMMAGVYFVRADAGGLALTVPVTIAR